MTPARRPARAVWMQQTFQIGVCRACRLADFSRAAWYKPSRAKDPTALRMRIRELARPRFGYVRIWVLLRLEGLQVRMRVRRRTHMALHRGPAPAPTGPGQRWSMDVVHDQLFNGRPFRVLKVVDQWSRQRPMLECGFSLTGHHVVTALDAASHAHGFPASITVDHGTECKSKAVQ